MRKILFILFALTVIFAKSQDTLTVMGYNILNYPLSNSSKADTLKPIIQFIQPDIFMITELTSSTGATTILNDALNVDGVTYYQKATYYNGPDTDNMLYYNTDKLTLYSQHEIPTVLRNISEYVLYYNNSALTPTSDTVFIYCYMAHLKASSGAANEQQRNQEAVSLKNYMDTRTNIENVFLGGDFNLYSSSEAAFNTILNGGNVLLFDPISSPGAWNSNSAFAGIHTQSTRSGILPDGGSYGGMDDRFDFLFVNNDIMVGNRKLTYLANSYKAVGNDGNHYNKSINATPTNTAVPTNIADALYYMSDHLPVTMKVLVDANVGISQENQTANWKGYFTHGKFWFTSEKPEQKLKVRVYNMLGEIVQTSNYQNEIKFNLNMNKLKKGMYFIHVISESKRACFKVINQ